MSHKMQIRETVLKDLEAFMASLRKIQSSIRRLTDSSGQPEIQEKVLREAAQEVSHMAKEAKCLDERLKAVDICLEDAECGGETWCEKLVLNLSEELTMTCGHSSDQMLTEENDLYKIFSTRNCELLKNIQDLRDRINKIGLKDPTIPAIQQRWILFQSSCNFIISVNSQGLWPLCDRALKHKCVLKRLCSIEENREFVFYSLPYNLNKEAFSNFFLLKYFVCTCWKQHWWKRNGRRLIVMILIFSKLILSQGDRSCWAVTWSKPLSWRSFVLFYHTLRKSPT